MITIYRLLIFFFLVFQESCIPKVVVYLKSFHKFELVYMTHTNIHEMAHLPTAWIEVIIKVIRGNVLIYYWLVAEDVEQKLKVFHNYLEYSNQLV